MKEGTYRTLIRPELLDSIYEQILKKMIVEKRYREQDYTAGKLAAEIGTNTRYISATVNQRFGKNFASLIGGFRIREAVFMLTDRRYRNKTIGEIATECGFANRQSFYVAFNKIHGTTPARYREDYLARQAEKKRKKDIS